MDQVAERHLLAILNQCPVRIDPAVVFGKASLREAPLDAELSQALAHRHHEIWVFVMLHSFLCSR